MSAQAVGAYIQVLMEDKNLKPSVVCAAAGVSANYIWRLTKGEIKKPGAEVLDRLITEVGGSIQHGRDLLLNELAGRDEGEKLARAYLALPEDLRNRAEAAYDSLDSEQVAAAIKELRARPHMAVPVLQLLRAMEATREN
jgi:transcriptional regulator with XRE-family HTH domain